MFDSSDLSKSLVQYVGNILREKDRDLYLCSLFTPAQTRGAIIALYAFNAEISMPGKLVDVPMIKEIRLKWWFDALAGVFSGAPLRHPVLELLEKVVPLGLKRHVLESLIEAEAANSEEEEGANAGRWRLIFLQVLDILGARSHEADKAAKNAAKAWGALTKLRQYPEQSTDVRADHDMISAYRAAVSGITGIAVPALLPAVLTDIYLERIKRVDYNMDHSHVMRFNFRTMAIFRLWLAVKRQRI